MNIFACLFRVHSAMGLSRHGQVCLGGLRFGDASLVGPDDGGGGVSLGAFIWAGGCVLGWRSMGFGHYSGVS